MRLPRPRVLVAVAAAFLAAGAGARFAALAHVRAQAGVPEGTVDLACGRCHGGSGWFRPAGDREGHPDPAGLALAPDGRTLVVACEGSDALALVDPRSGEVRRRIPLVAGSLPHGVALSPDGRIAFVSLRGRDRVAAVDLASGAVRESEETGRGPMGLALDPAGRTLVVANGASDDIALVDTGTLRVRARLAAGREPAAAAVSPDGRFAHVAARLSAVHPPAEVPAAEVTVIDLERGAVAARVPLPSCHMSEGIAFLPDGSASLVPAVRVRNLVPILQVGNGWVMSSVVALVPAAGDGPAALLPLDDLDRYFADPSGVAIAPDGRTAWIAAGGGNAVTALDLAALRGARDAAAEAAGPDPADRLDLASRYAGRRIPVGANPRAVLADRSGERVFVAERWAGTVALLDAASGEVLARADLGGPRVPSARRRGDRVFHDAAVTFQGQFSCRSCHPDGHQDGLVYDFETDGPGRNPVDNRSLLGLRGTAPFKWIGLNRTLRDQCGPRFARVLTRADPFAEADLADLDAYLESLPARAGRPAGAGGPEPAAVARGREVFLRRRTNDGRPVAEEDRCVTCHPPPLYTNRKVVDVGTGGPLDTATAFDVPHLGGVEGSAPYLHDGKAATLEAIWTLHNPYDRHGITNDMTKQQLNDLVEFLRTL